MEKIYYIYILASAKNGTLYIGVTSDLIKRVFQHKSSFVPGFSKRYSIYSLVYFEQYSDPYSAIKREKRLKKYTREQKIKLIEKENKEWRDLYNEITS